MTIICYSRKESIVSNETNDSDRLENPPSEELRSVYSDSEEEFVQFPEFNPKKEMLHPELEVENKFRSKEEFKAEVIGEASRVVIGQPSGEPLFYSQLRSASAGSNVKEQLFLSQHGASTAPNLPRPKAKPMRKCSAPQRRIILRKNSISTLAIQSAWQNLMESRPR
ncbi:Uncharacterized protein Fot_06384 [Forsythia ovata]|uniref:Uncharacterized protein n=1 Tax=Forsythia ovata TaxID=205694 RepID=A0ABD1WST1_9LAMI